MPVTKKHTWEPVTDNLLEADKSLEYHWDNSEQHHVPYKGSLAPGRGSWEAAGRTHQLGKEPRVLGPWDGRRRLLRAGTSLRTGPGLRSVGSRVQVAASPSEPWCTRLSTPGR